MCIHRGEDGMNMNMNINVWMVRPIPNETNRMQEFLTDNFIAIGYPMGHTFKGMEYEQIKASLESKGKGLGIGNVNTFVRVMKPGDLIMVPNSNNSNKRDVYIGKINSHYMYVPEVDKDEEGSGYPHQRGVQWYFDKQPLLRSELPEEIRGSLRYPKTIADLTKHRDLVISIVNGDHVLEEDSLEEQALNIVRTHLHHEDPLVQLRAAEIILNR